MSVKALNWAFEQPLSGNEKCVLLALADYANDDGVCWPGQETLARKAHVSTKTISRIAAKLEQMGYLARKARFRSDGARTSDLTVLPLDRLTNGQVDHRTNRADQQTPVSGEPSVEPPGEASPHSLSARELKLGGMTVNRKHWDLAVIVLAAFNDRSGRKYRHLKSSGQPSEAAKYVYKRIREYPDLTYEEHVSIIERTLASAWWGDDQASFNVVYGPRVFEENITRPGIRRRGATVGAKRGDDPEKAAILRQMRLAREERG